MRVPVASFGSRTNIPVDAVTDASSSPVSAFPSSAQSISKQLLAETKCIELIRNLFYEMTFQRKIPRSRNLDLAKVWLKYFP